MANCDRKDCAARLPGATQAPQFGGYGCDPTVAQVTPKPYEPRFRKGDWVMWQGEPALLPWQAECDDGAEMLRGVVPWTPRVGDVVRDEGGGDYWASVVGRIGSDGGVFLSHCTSDSGKTWRAYEVPTLKFSASRYSPAPAPFWASWRAWQAESPADRFVREAKAAGAKDVGFPGVAWRPLGTRDTLCNYWSDGLVTVSVHGLPPAAALEVIALANKLRGRGEAK